MGQSWLCLGDPERFGSWQAAVRETQHYSKNTLFRQTLGIGSLNKAAGSMRTTEH
jgi:hypothetical protein